MSNQKNKIKSDLTNEMKPPNVPNSFTPSGIEVPISVTPDMVDFSEVGSPGQYPFTRGIFENGFRGRLWTIRQFCLNKARRVYLLLSISQLSAVMTRLTQWLGPKLVKLAYLFQI